MRGRLDQALCFLYSLMQDLTIVQEFNDVTDFKHSEINQHTSHFWSQAFMTSVFLNQWEQQFSKNGSLLLLWESQEIIDFLFKMWDGERFGQHFLMGRLDWSWAVFILFLINFLWSLPSSSFVVIWSAMNWWASSSLLKQSLLID